MVLNHSRTSSSHRVRELSTCRYMKMIFTQDYIITLQKNVSAHCLNESSNLGFFEKIQKGHVVFVRTYVVHPRKKHYCTFFCEKNLNDTGHFLLIMFTRYLENPPGEWIFTGAFMVLSSAVLPKQAPQSQSIVTILNIQIKI